MLDCPNLAQSRSRWRVWPRRWGAFLERPKTTMLLPEDEVDWQKYHTIRSFTCPGFREKPAMLFLALRMMTAGMLGYTDDVAETLALFTVAKKLLPCGRWIQRLVIDYRRGNCLFRTPPWLPMGSPASSGWMELDTESWGGLSFYSVVGDKPRPEGRG